MSLSDKIIDMNKLINTTEDFYPDLKNKKMIYENDIKKSVKNLKKNINEYAISNREFTMIGIWNIINQEFGDALNNKEVVE